MYVTNSNLRRVDHANASRQDERDFIEQPKHLKINSIQSQNSEINDIYHVNECEILERHVFNFLEQSDSDSSQKIDTRHTHSVMYNTNSTN